jgi:peptide/nickel transport system permease protein
VTAYILGRLVHSVFVLAGLAIVNFLVTRVVGDPARLMLPLEATEQQYRAFRADLGLDDPPADAAPHPPEPVLADPCAGHP